MARKLLCQYVDLMRLQDRFRRQIAWASRQLGLQNRILVDISPFLSSPLSPPEHAANVFYSFPRKTRTQLGCEE